MADQLNLNRYLSVEENFQSPKNLKYCTKGFLIKVLQLALGIICIGLYAGGMELMAESTTSLTFPNIVFSCFTIITSVILMGYILGDIMPDLLLRIFNAMGMILYFVSATLCLYTWVDKSGTVATPLKLLAAQAVLSYVNSFLYGFDMFLSIKKAITIVD